VGIERPQSLGQPVDDVAVGRPVPDQRRNILEEHAFDWEVRYVADQAGVIHAQRLLNGSRSILGHRSPTSPRRDDRHGAQAVPNRQVAVRRRARGGGSNLGLAEGDYVEVDWDPDAGALLIWPRDAYQKRVPQRAYVSAVAEFLRDHGPALAALEAD